MRWHLVDDWRQSLKWHSMRLLCIFASLQVAYAMLPQRIHDDLPGWATQGLALILTVGALIGRLVAQPDKETDNVPDKPVQS